MLSLTRDLLRKTQDKSASEIKPLTVCFWSDFAANPAVMYELFSPNPRQLDYNPEKVKVMGTADGMIKSVYKPSYSVCTCSTLVKSRFNTVVKFVSHMRRLSHSCSTYPLTLSQTFYLSS